MNRLASALLGVGLTAVTVAGRPLMDDRALMDSARSVPPKVRLEWLYHRGVEMPGYACSRMTDSGLALVAKWGRGPAAEVTGKDTLVVLTLGSEVALLNFANPDSPRVLSEIQFPSLTVQSCLRDSLLYTSSNADLEIWNVADPAQPVKRGQIPAPVGDFWIRDTLLFFIRRDTFHAYSIANPASPYQLGWYRDSGSVTTGSGNTVVAALGSFGFLMIDVTNPASPHRAGSYACGHALSAAARGNLCCVSYEDNSYPYPVHFRALDISVPSVPLPLGHLANLGGYDIYLDSSLAFVSGRSWPDQPFQVISIADSAHPSLIDSCLTTERYNWGVWASLSLQRAFVADEYDGLAVVDISNLNNAVLDTWVLKTGSATDLSVDGQRCFVACGSGMRVLDVSDPTRPTCISGLDTAFVDDPCHSVAARDSFAFMTWYLNPSFRTVSVADPFKPEVVAACSLLNPAEDVVLRDSLVYVAANYRFQVVNVARPRQPVVVGTCGLPDYSYEMDMKDTLAFVANGSGGLLIVNVARPADPAIIGSIAFPNPTVGVAVRDSFAYVGANHLRVVNVARPSSPFVVDSVLLPVYGRTVTTSDTMLYVGTCLGYAGDLRAFSIADPASPRLVGFYGTPIGVNRVVCAAPYVYAACSDAGIVLLETTATGVLEPEAERRAEPAIRVEPNPAGDFVRVRLSELPASGSSLRLFDVTGREALAQAIGEEAHGIILNLTDLRPGLYFVRVESRNGVHRNKLVKR